MPTQGSILAAPMNKDISSENRYLRLRTYILSDLQENVIF